MKRKLAAFKQNVIKLYDLILELEKIPMRNFSGEFYEEKNKEPRIQRKNNVRVEDLRPKTKSE